MNYRLVDNIKVWGEPLPNAVAQMLNCSKDDRVVDCALMADHHLGYSVPIGGVIAYDNYISPSGVGYDIACGNKAVKLDIKYQDLRPLGQLMDDIVRTISFGVGRTNQEEEVPCGIFDGGDYVETWLELPTGLKDKARKQLGTVGSGNHYIDLFRDDEDNIWIGVHFGSRGLGHTIASHFIEKGGGTDGINADPVLLNLGDYLGQAYHRAMHMAGEYAYAGRSWVCARVAQLIDAPIIDEVHNHHNFSWTEIVSLGDGSITCQVVRKGATPCYPGQVGFIGGTMADRSYIIQGKESPESNAALYSTVHGAGRIMSRTAAAGKSKGWGHKRRQISPGLVSQGMMDDRVRGANVILRGAGVDEAPQCYKNLDEVLFAHRDTLDIITTLYPIGVAMADGRTLDPYKD